MKVGSRKSERRERERRRRGGIHESGRRRRRAMRGLRLAGKTVGREASRETDRLFGGGSGSESEREGDDSIFCQHTAYYQ